MLMFPVLFGSILFVFIATRTILPGDPVLVWLEEDYTIEEYNDMRDYLGLDKPVYIQFGQFLNRILHGDLGYSYLSEKPVAEAIRERMSLKVDCCRAPQRQTKKPATKMARAPTR